MSDENTIDRHTSRATLTHDGKDMIEQPGGGLRQASSRTDWDRVAALTEQDILNKPRDPIPMLSRLTTTSG